MEIIKECKNFFESKKNANTLNAYPLRSALNITFVYILTSTLWIFFSDNIVNIIFSDHNIIKNISIVKGLVYIGLTGTVIFLLCNKSLNELIKSQKTLSISEERYKLAVEGANDAIWDWDLLAKTFEISPEWSKKINSVRHTSEMSPKLLLYYVQKNDRSKVLVYLNEVMTTDYMDDFKFECRIKTEESYIWANIRGKILRADNGKALRMAGSITDITESKNLESSYKKLAYYDGLTGLANRSMFTINLKKEIKKSLNTDNKFAVLFIDLDNFKTMNDTYGHHFGDRYLERVADKISEVEWSGGAFVSRFGGDEFAVLLRGLKSTECVSEYINKVLISFDAPWIVEGYQIFPSLSIGAAICPDDSLDGELLIRYADMAMYRAKEKRHSSSCFFEKEYYNELVQKNSMERQLCMAVRNEEFVLYYQPQVDGNNYRIVALEALIRWNSPIYGLVPPAKFIPMAEEIGLISDIGYWVLREACKQVKILEKIVSEEIKISVNVSALQLRDKDFVKRVDKIVKEEGVKPQSIILEITESIVVSNFELNREIINELRESGFKIAIDDFGMGYSSLNYLNQIPIDELKIDKAFIHKINENKNKSAIVDVIIELSHRLGYIVTVEGIENIEELEYMKDKNCDKIQSYIFSPPLSGDELLKKIGNINLL